MTKTMNSNSRSLINTMTTHLATSVTPEAFSLFCSVQKLFPTTLGPEKWYLTVAAALVASGKPKVVGELYSHLVSQAEYGLPAQRQQLVRRIREALVQCCILCGVPVVLEATKAVAERERVEDRDLGFIRKNWQIGETNTARAMERFNLLYKDDLPKILSNFEAHKDIIFMAVDIQYGLVLAEPNELDPVETELVALPAVMCQSLAGPTMWHLRGAVRAGIQKDDVELVHQAIELVAKYAGKRLIKIGRVEDVTEEMHDRL